MRQYFTNGESGDSFEGATLHYSRECADDAGDGVARPLAAGVVDTVDGFDYCPDCTDHDGDTSGTSEATDDGWELTKTDEPTNKTTEEIVESGVCPWCDSDPYEGEHVGRHASSAHPEEWNAYKDAK